MALFAVVFWSLVLLLAIVALCLAGLATGAAVAASLAVTAAVAGLLFAFRKRLRSLLLRGGWAPILYLLLFAAVALGHLTLLRLPYFWDEGGYYIPAALDFYHRGTLVPEFTNAHPPLPNVVIGTVWHLVGMRILATRLTACAFAALGLFSLFQLARRLLGPLAAAVVTLLTAVYPIWYAQSSLAHADIFAAGFTLSALALYLPAQSRPSMRRLAGVAALFSLAVLSKETAIVWPATLAVLELAYLLLRRARAEFSTHARWFAAMCTPVLPLLGWYAYHHAVTGFTFGNPEYLRYNATANFTAGHIFLAWRYRFLHIFLQRNMWLPLVLAAACLLLTRKQGERPVLSRRVAVAITALVAANWIFFSVLGGALLTRYLLPVYPLLLLVCVAVWQAYTRAWPWLALLTAAAFISGWWLSPATSFAPEDCLAYRDMIVVHQQAIAYIDQHIPAGTVLTAWPGAAELFRPELGYTDRRIKVTSIEDFSAAEIAKAAAEPERYETALVFTTKFTEPSLRHWLLAHPDSARGREYAEHRDLTPEEIALALGGTVVFRAERHGEWAAVLRFPRSYAARMAARGDSSDSTLKP